MRARYVLLPSRAVMGSTPADVHRRDTVDGWGADPVSSGSHNDLSSMPWAAPGSFFERTLAKTAVRSTPLQRWFLDFIRVLGDCRGGAPCAAAR